MSRPPPQRCIERLDPLNHGGAARSAPLMAVVMMEGEGEGEKGGAERRKGRWLATGSRGSRVAGSQGRKPALH